MRPGQRVFEKVRNVSSLFPQARKRGTYSWRNKIKLVGEKDERF